MESVELADRARRFTTAAPYREVPFSKRNWGGTLHSLCSYQGKLKPSIAHFLINEFTAPGERVLDPMAGVSTIPLEARLQGRVGLAGDLSTMAYVVSKAKLEPFDTSDVWDCLAGLQESVKGDDLASSVDTSFGLNGPIESYFHQDTLREVVAAREYFRARLPRNELTSAEAVVMTAILHILHGNRPYALSRQSHPITPFAPTGVTEYRSLIGKTEERLARVLDPLANMRDRPEGSALLRDFRDLPGTVQPVDAVITSPPFSSSLRFWSSNWMRLWFSGWEPADFKTQPARFLETEQRTSFAAYGAFAVAMRELLKPGGRLIMHLGETPTANMVTQIGPWLDEAFEVAHVGRECVRDTESHGLRDKGATVAHWYLFATRR